jgi:hypothetical protein
LFPPADPTGAADAVDGWKIGLTMLACVTQSAWGINDFIIDIYAGQQDGGVTPKIPVVIDVVAPLILWIAGWPGSPNADGTTGAPFANPVPTSGTDGNLLVPTMFLELVDPFCAAINYMMGADRDPDDPPQSTFGQYFYPVLNMGAAIALTVLESKYNWDTDQGKPAEAIGILGNFSNVLSPLATAWAADASDDVSTVVKAIADVAANVGTGFCFFLQWDYALNP